MSRGDRQAYFWVGEFLGEGLREIRGRGWEGLIEKKQGKDKVPKKIRLRGGGQRLIRIRPRPNAGDALSQQAEVNINFELRSFGSLELSLLTRKRHPEGERVS